MEVIQGQSKYRAIAAAHVLPLHFTPEWLDATSHDNWNTIMVLNDDEDLVGLMVYSEFHKGPFRIIKMPPLTTYSGPIIFYPHGMRTHTRRSFEKQVMTVILENIPLVHFYYQQWPPEIDNWLPWKWKNYRQTTLYTYRILPQNSGKLYANLRGNIRTDLKKARSSVQITLSDNLSELFHLVSLSHLNQKIRVPFSIDQLKKLDQALLKINGRKIFIGRHQERAISAIYMAYDQYKAYYITGGVDPEFRGTAAKSLCIWYAIEDAMKNGLIFDFEGSDIPGLEHFFRGWGGQLTPYFKVFKARNLLFKLASMRYKGYY